MRRVSWGGGVSGLGRLWQPDVPALAVGGADVLLDRHRGLHFAPGPRGLVHYQHRHSSVTEHRAVGHPLRGREKFVRNILIFASLANPLMRFLVCRLIP